MKKTIQMVIKESRKVLRSIEECFRCECDPLDYFDLFESLSSYVDILPRMIRDYVSQNETALSQNETYSQKKKQKK